LYERKSILPVKAKMPGTILLRILLLSDGIAGHYRQSEGVVAALRRRHDVTVQRIEIKPPAFIPRRLLTRLAKILPQRLFLRLLRIKTERLQPADLIVSAGAMTLGANAALAKILKAPNIFSGTARGFSPDAITLTLLPYPSAAQKPGHLYALKPSTVDPDNLPFLPAFTTLANQPVALLIGGSTAHVRFTPADWVALGDTIRHLANTHNIHWHIVTSRRTPPEAYEVLDAIIPLLLSATFTDFRAQGTGSIKDAFAYPVIFATGDSLSMVSEAVAAQRRTLALMPDRVSAFRDAEALDAMEQNGHIARIALSKLAQTDLHGHLLALTPRTVNHLDELYAGLIMRLHTSFSEHV
jgi:uncharacterized protein